MVARATCTLTAIALLGAAPAAQAPKYGPVPQNAQTAAVKRYVAALRAKRYDSAFAMLTDEEHGYYGDAASFRSVFDADGYVLENATVVGARGDDKGRVYFVRERLSFVDHATDKRHTLDATVPLGILPEHGALHVKDPGKPYRAFASSSSADASGLRVTVKKVDFYPDRIDVVLTLTNTGANFVTVLPYGKSVLRDDRGGVYRILSNKDWTVTDRRLYEGASLAPNTEYTGSIAFSTDAKFGDAKRAWSLTVSPALREEGDAPFEVTVAISPNG